MFSREKLSESIGKLVEQQDLRLFDIDYPTVATPTLRVYVWRPNTGELAKADSAAETAAVVSEASKASSAKVERRGVTLDECARVARAITDWFEQDAVSEADEWLLEVSSPGVNRRLRSKEHFKSAVGERVKLTLLQKDADSKLVRKTIVGKIEAVGEDSLDFLFKDDSKTSAMAKKGKRKEKRSPSFGAAKQLKIDFDSIEEARVDFIF